MAADQSPHPRLFSLEGKTAVVTGGSRGIGAMIARGLLDAGASVVISSRKQSELDDARIALSAFGDVHAIRADVSTLEGVEKLAAEVAAHFPTLNILVNNAGATWGMPLDDFSEHAWDKVMDTNVKGVFFLTQRLLPNLRAGAASKAGVHHLTRALARKLGPQHITVNAIAPGPFESKMMAATLQAFGESIAKSSPLGRIGRPDDMAGVAVFLASRAGSYVTGSVIAVDGGIATTA